MVIICFLEIGDWLFTVIKEAQAMTKVGGTTKKYYKETRGIKVSGGAQVRAGTVLTRRGDRWQPGLNVIGITHLTAACDGQVYFTRKKGNYKRVVTLVHIRPAESSNSTSKDK